MHARSKLGGSNEYSAADYTDDYYDEAAAGGGGASSSSSFSDNNDWMTHRRPISAGWASSNQEPLAQWIQDRQRAFAEFSKTFHQPNFFETTPSQLSISHQPWPNQQRIINSADIENSSRQLPRAKMMASQEASLSPKAKVSYDEGQFAVEIPLKDYKPEELSVKTEGNVLVILAKHETQTESGGSFVSKQFEQRFSLPSGVKPEAVVSSLSKEGILKVTAPRMTSSASQPSSSIGSFRKTRGAIEEDVFVPQTTQVPQNQGLPHPKVTYDDDKFQISLDCKHFKPEELDVKVDGTTIIITAKQEVKESGGTRTRVFEQKFTLPNGVHADRVTSTINADGVLTINAPKGKAPASSMNHIEQIMDRNLSPRNWSDHSNFADFDAEESGKSRAFIDGDLYKIEINVQNFKPEELVIKTVGQTVQVEAKHEEKTADGASFSSRNFSQSFTLPREIDPETVASSLSKAGTLTIEAPLPKAKSSIANERLVPIKRN